MAYLARRRDTFAIRLLLLPVTILFAIIPAYGCVSPPISGKEAIIYGKPRIFQILLAPAVASGVELDTRFVIPAVLYCAARDPPLTTYV